MKINTEIHRVVVISYDLCSKYVALFTQLKFQVVIVDEAHYLKNAMTKRAGILIPFLKKVRHVILLTGTPALARPKELFSLCTIAKPHVFMYFKEFGYRYCFPKYSKYSKGLDYDGASNMKELNVILNSFMIRRLKKDVLSQLPPKRRQKVQVPTDPKISAEIQEVLKESGNDNLENLISSLQDEYEGVDMYEIMNRAHNHKKLQLWEALIRCYKLTGMAKINGVKDYLRTLLENDTKFIVFAHHLEILDILEEDLRSCKIRYARVDGSVAHEKRHERLKAFQTEKSVKVALLSLTASSVGFNLTAASNIIFAEMHWTPATMLQAEDRAHRIGQEYSVNIHYLYAKESLDDILLRKLMNKVAVVSEVLDGKKSSLEVKRTVNYEKMREEECMAINPRVSGMELLDYFKEPTKKKKVKGTGKRGRPRKDESNPRTQPKSRVKPGRKKKEVSKLLSADEELQEIDENALDSLLNQYSNHKTKSRVTKFKLKSSNSTSSNCIEESLDENSRKKVKTE